jgi:parallel beta-helix repeat protein
VSRFWRRPALVVPLVACGFALAIGTAPLVPPATARSAAPTPECGYITANAEWTVAGSPYQLTCTVLVYPNVTLTIDPGVTVQAASDAQLWVKGGLVASGTGANPIIFTTSGASSWPGILIDSSISSATLTMDYATVQNAQFAIQAGVGASTVGHIRNSTIEGSVQGGLSVGGDPNFDVTSNTITNNRGYGISVGGAATVASNNIVSNPGHGMTLSGGTIQGNVISGNGCNGIVVTSTYGYTLSDNTITSNFQDGLYVEIYGALGTFGVEQNNIHGNGRYAIEQGSQSQAGVDATNVWWGTTDSSAIDAEIYDFYDDPYLGVVSFNPFLSGPVAGAPPDPGIPLPTSGGTACLGGLPTPTPTSSPTLTPTPTSTPTATTTPSPTRAPLIPRAYLPDVATGAGH